MKRGIDRYWLSRASLGSMSIEDSPAYAGRPKVGFGMSIRNWFKSVFGTPTGELPRSARRSERLTDIEARVFRNGNCPDCGVEQLLDGPCAGGSTNVYCVNARCGSRFNETGFFGVERISDAAPLSRRD